MSGTSAKVAFKVLLAAAVLLGAALARRRGEPVLPRTHPKRSADHSLLARDARGEHVPHAAPSAPPAEHPVQEPGEPRETAESLLRAVAETVDPDEKYALRMRLRDLPPETREPPGLELHVDAIPEGDTLRLALRVDMRREGGKVLAGFDVPRARRVTGRAAGQAFLSPGQSMTLEAGATVPEEGDCVINAVVYHRPRENGAWTVLERRLRARKEGPLVRVEPLPAARGLTFDSDR